VDQSRRFSSLSCPFGELVWRIIKSELGANPVEFLQHATGDWTLRFLVFTLCITPFRKLFKLPDLIRFRRMLGLFAFFYVPFTFSPISDRTSPSISPPCGKTSPSALSLPWAFWFRSINSSGDHFHGRLDSASRGKRWQQLHRAIYVTAFVA